VARDRRDHAVETRAAEVRARIDTLTARERQVFALVVTGMLNKQIAAELGIVEKTVKVHRGRVMEKLRAGSFAELVRLGDRAGVAAARDLPRARPGPRSHGLRRRSPLPWWMGRC
jgi:FixJ family two-component response regulator